MITPIDTYITAVTVYTDRALVTRQGNITLTGGETGLTLANLPNTLDPESVRVSGRGDVAVKLQGVQVDRIYTTESVTARVAELTAAIEGLESEQQHHQAAISSLDLQIAFIQGMCEKTEAAFSRGLARREIALSDTLEFLNFLGRQHTEYLQAKETIQQQQRQLKKQLTVLQSELEQIRYPHSQESFQITATITPSGAGQFNLTVTYVVLAASWTPLYDLRVHTTEKQLYLSYLAEITQNSGEDWQDVDLVLSTAKPGLGSLPPKLSPWYVDVFTPPASPMPPMRTMAAPMMMPEAPAPMVMVAKSADFALESAAPRPQIAAETVTAAVTQQGGTVTFQLGGRGNIPNDGNPHKATILEDQFPCQLTYVTMPHLVSFAYLLAELQNRPDGATFLAGKANIFRDQTFVGTTILPHVAASQTCKLHLGIDEGIQVQRELIERQVDKKFMGGDRRITYAYRLEVRNLLNDSIQLELNDQIPHSRNEQVKVKLTKINPVVSLGELGRLQWLLDLSALEKKEIYYQFAVEYPAQLQVTGLNI